MTSSNEFRELGTRENMNGPQIGSFWLHIVGEAIRGYTPDDTTILRVTGWSRWGTGDDPGGVDLLYYSLNGSTNNRGYHERDIPEELRRITITDFWNSVDDGRLVHLVPVQRDFAEDKGIFSEGDTIKFIPDSENP